MMNSLRDNNAPLEALYDVIAALGAWREALIEIAVRLRSDPICESVRSGMDIRGYDAQLMIELFVDTELASGSALTFWIDIVPSALGPWHVTSSIRRMAGTDQVPIRTVEDTDVSSLRALNEVLEKSLETFSRTDLSIALDCLGAVTSVRG